VSEAITHSVRIIRADGRETVLQVSDGANLRRALLDAGLTPYGELSKRINCSGRGLCATCGVWLDDPPAPDHWHDRAASAFGYPRLSCQITITGPLTVRLIDGKLIWGQRDAFRRWTGRNR
jgi:ferredoxin